MSASLKLKRVLGLSSSGHRTLQVQPKSGKLVYFAGCVVLLLDPRAHTQHQLVCGSKQNITAIVVSDDGRYLASADCGASATLRVWDLHRLALEVELGGRHSAEVACMCFSADAQLLVSVGGQQDLNLLVWDWRLRRTLAAHKLSCKVRAVSFAADSSYLVTVGEASVKFWFLQREADGSVSLSGRSAALADHKRASFVDVRCARGASPELTYCLTKAGHLCELNAKRAIHKWLDLRTASASSLRLGPSTIVVGCANGDVRCFSAPDLRFLKNLPRPHALGSWSAAGEQVAGGGLALAYPDALCADLDEASHTLACAYNDHSLYAWDVTNGVANATLIHASLYHSSCIWGLDMWPSSPTGAASFVTCSSDETVRIWSSQLLGGRPPAAAGAEPPPDELVKILFTDSAHKFLCNANLDYHTNQGLRCLRISPDGRHLAVGARSGAIKIFDLQPGDKPENVMLKSIAAHDAEVLCLEYSDPERFANFYYLASSSRDKLIHLFDARADYAFLQTVDDHTSSITALRFVNNRAADCLQLVSCGADRKIIFRNGLLVAADQSGLGRAKLEFVAERQIDGKATFYDMEVDGESSCLMLACQDRQVRLFSVAQARYQSSFAGSTSDHGTLIKIALDPSCTFLAASSTDKTISIYDYQRGERIASISDGLADLVTDLKFSRDGRHMVASTGDGCIFIWSSPAEIANTVSGHLDLEQLSSCSLVSSSAEPTPEPPPTSGARAWPARAAAAPAHVHSSWSQDKDASDLSGADSTGAGSGSATSRSYRVMRSADGPPSGIPSSIRAARHLTNSSLDETGSEAAGQSPQPPTGLSRIYRGQQASSAPSWLRPSSASKRLDEPAGGLVSSMAKLFQSRENLDKISSRERFVAEALDPAAAEPAAVRGRQTLSVAHANPSDAPNGTPKSERDNSSDDPDLDVHLPEPAKRPPSPLRSRSLSRRPASKHLAPVAGSTATTWASLDPNEVELSRELCQRLADDLHAASKFATRLHPRLQGPEHRDLASLVARAVHNAMDILSIVPARSMSNQRSGGALSGLSSGALTGRGPGQPTSTVSGLPRHRGRSQQPSQPRASSVSRPGSATGQRAPLPATPRTSRADTMARKRTPHQMPTPAISRTVSSGSGLNIDQVLEAYSDRLFRMVQERMAAGPQQVPER